MKKSKRLLSVLLAGVLLLSSLSAAIVTGAQELSDVKVAVISDIRYQQDARDRDGLLLSKSAAMLDAALANVKASNADALLVTGDLTNNGSKTSHQYVAAKLAEVEAEGINVYVIPGEHDIREGGTTTAVSRSVFEDIYKDFGYSEPVQDANSASYVADLGNGFKVVMSDSVAADGEGQLTQWVVDQAKSAVSAGSTVFAASHHPAVTRSSVDRVFIDLLHTMAGLTLNIGGSLTQLYTNDPDQAAADLGLQDTTCILSTNGVDSGALADAGVKYLFSGHGGTLSISQATTTTGAQMYDVMAGSLVNASASVRYATLSKAAAGMKQQRAEFTTDMLGDDAFASAAHDALEAQMPAEVDYAIEVVEKVFGHLLPAIQPNVGSLVRNLDLAALGVSLPSILDGLISDVKNDLVNGYVNPLFDLLSVTKLHNIIADVRCALEKMDFNGQNLYAFLADIFTTIQRGDGKTPASVQGFFDALKGGDSAMLVDIINSFADNFDPTNLVSLVNEVLNLNFSKSYVAGIATISVNLRGLLAGPYTVVDAGAINKTTIDLWSILDGLATLPNGQTISQVARPLVNDLILGGENDASTNQTPARFTQNLKANAQGVVDMLIGFGVGDLIGDSVFAQGQSGAYVARTVTLEEVGAILDELVPDNNVVTLNPAVWADVRDALNAAGRFTAEQLATINSELVAATDTEPAYTQLDKLGDLADDTFYKGVADLFTQKVNQLPAVEELQLSDAGTVYDLVSEYDQFYSEIKAYVSEATVEKLNAALAQIRALENYDPDVDAVIKKIAAIGTVTVDSEDAINEARAAYNDLSVKQQKDVTNYQVLVDAENTLVLVKENAVKIASVEQTIDAIGEVTYTTASKMKIDLARSAYNNLAAELQPQVSNYAVLEAAEARYAELQAEVENTAAAAPVINLINAIGEVTLNSKAAIEAAEAAYAQLTEEQQAYVTNYNVLVLARQAYDALAQEDVGNREAAQTVIDLINAIGDVTLESESAITAARTAYNKLTAAQQALVTNYNVLTNAEILLADLQKQAADEAAAQAVEELIDAIGEVTVEKEEQINAARDAYNQLTNDQKRLVDNLAVLTAAEAQLSVLKNDFLFEDGATGITLRADSGVLPLDTVMTVTRITSGDVYDAVTAGNKAARIYTISLTSAGEPVVPTKAVRIAIPQFAPDTAVYAVGADAQMTALETTLESGSFNFSTTSVGTFAVVQAKTYVDTQALEDAIDAFEALGDSALYEQTGYGRAQSAYETACDELAANYELTTANQQKVDAAAAALNNAIAVLTYQSADVSALQNALAKAAVLNAEDYTDFSAVTAAVEAGNAFLSGAYDVRDQAKAAELAQAITDAISKLVYAPADFTAIDEALATVPKDLQNYTAETIKILEAAIEAATEAKATITRQDENWKAQVEAYAQAVLDAVSGLQKTGVIYADTSLLELALDMVDLYNPADYTNFSAVEMAVLSAESLLASNPTEAQQADVDAAAMEVLNAIGALEWA